MAASKLFVYPKKHHPAGHGRVDTGAHLVVRGLTETPVRQ
jgi:hypothetical protein